MTSSLIPSPFRDPSGFLFEKRGRIYRQVNTAYGASYNYLMSSGFYEAPITACLPIPYGEVDIESPRPDLAYRIIKPELLPYMKYF